MTREDLIKEAYAYGVGVALVEAGFEKNAAAEMAIEITNEELYKLAKKDAGMSTEAKAGLGAAAGLGTAGAIAGALAGRRAGAARTLPKGVAKWLKRQNIFNNKMLPKVPGFRKLRRDVLKQNRGKQGLGGHATTAGGIAGGVAGGAGGAALGGAAGAGIAAATKKKD
jgi:hypothetical protein